MGRHPKRRHRRQRRVLNVFVVLMAAFVAFVAGCGGNPPAAPSGSDSDEPAPAEAQDAIVKGLETMFTWFPARDASPRDAYIRALPYFGSQLQNGKDNTLERGNSVWWQGWKAEKAEVTAKALLVAGEHPEDKPDTVQRAVVVTQTVKAADGEELDSTTMRIDRVVAKKGPQGWRVEEINFFPENEFRTKVCPPGQSHQPAPDGPCVPNPPPPPKQCPDGSTVPADQVCPPPVTGPNVTQCPDGTSVPAGAACPATGPVTTPPTAGKTCPEGQSPDSSGTCQCPSGTVKDGDRCVTPCPEGQTRNPDGNCECPSGTVKEGEQCVKPCATGETRNPDGTCKAQPCPDGQTRKSDGTCPTGTPCPDGTTVYGDDTCPVVPCPDGTSVPNGQTCPPVKCADGSSVPNGQTCPPVSCADGSSVPNGQTCPPVQCADGSSVPNGQTCPPVQCPNGTTVPNGQTCPPVILQKKPPVSASCTAGTPGGFGPVCTCPPGYDLSSGNMCVESTGPGPVVHFAPTGHPSAGAPMSRAARAIAVLARPPDRLTDCLTPGLFICPRR
ncbi:putative transmembrane protein [Mycolicibacterium mageritense DSM 44476 = CIP 104973]|uniref:Uncharacterized protein n=1 Tax=Mycolicibacterium mageritense TaxID=53462 RepID=A0ABM7I0V3_MYCME|nr:hypothetical protein [Mycolicibacterium mageritense]MCC9181410.1 hypothetical protein [Mycolicibacterium mageritense]BBX36510.1 hypothetical protein MMAGJ_57920 [Mycolicibacterium mageritense]GJJ23281.1 hypothetical protein MTY414_69540 [Mycolicibacterium mageritense]CDO24615.1 hypothetical protein BN978_05111 [Mycolicibacterium mageritense DSM 44476 = CIP 104973]